MALLLRVVPLISLNGIFNPDEPHHINIALNFGTGDLNPHVFKYPTLWMYLLFLVYGFTFLFWSGFGLLHSISDFACLFINDPPFFFLIARILTVTCGIAALLWIFFAGRRLDSIKIGLGAAFIGAISPELITLGSIAKPDMLMLFFSSLAWWFSAKYYTDGKMKNSLLAGFALGFAASSQYTAGVFLFPLLFLAHMGRNKWKMNLSNIFSPQLILGYGLLLAAFFVGTPFALLDRNTFFADIGDLRDYGSGHFEKDAPLLGIKVILNFASFAGFIPFGVILLVMGISALAVKKRPLLGFLLPPLIFGGILLAFQTRTEPRYGLSLFPGIALLMASNILWIQEFDRKKILFILLVATGFLWIPGLQFSTDIRQLGKSDPRIEAKHWIEQNIPAGSRLLMEQMHSGPNLKMAPSQAKSLFEKTSALKNPRANYFKHFLNCGNDGKFKIFRIKRSYKNLVSMKRHTEWSQVGYDLIDVENGMENVFNEKIDYVVESDYGNNLSSSNPLSGFFGKLHHEQELVASFPAHIAVNIPSIFIYKVKKR